MARPEDGRESDYRIRGSEFAQLCSIEYISSVSSQKVVTRYFKILELHIQP